jgi:hypothetical protein
LQEVTRFPQLYPVSRIGRAVRGFVVGIAAVAFARSDTPAQQETVLQGRVTDRENGHRVAGAKVTAVSASALTGDDGGFHLTVSRASVFVVQAVKPGYVPASKEIAIAAGTKTMEIENCVRPFGPSNEPYLRFAAVDNSFAQRASSRLAADAS